MNYQARVGPGIEQVHHQIDADIEQPDHQQVGGDHRHVHPLDGRDEQEPQSRPLEDGLGDDGKGNERAQLQADDGNDGDEGVAQRMPTIQRGVAQTPGACKADVVAAQHVQHLGAHQPHDERELEEAQRDGGQHQRRQPGDSEQPGLPAADIDQRSPPEGRQPLQLNREQVDEATAPRLLKSH